MGYRGWRVRPKESQADATRVLITSGTFANAMELHSSLSRWEEREVTTQEETCFGASDIKNFQVGHRLQRA